MEQIFKLIALRADLANHAFYGLLTYSLLSFYSPLLAIIVVVLQAVGKEIWDSFGNGTPDVCDAVATAGVPIVLFGVQYVIM